MQKLVFINGAGNEIDLTAGNFGITNWAGLSNTSLNIQTQQVPFEDGGVFLDALMEQREIEVTVAIYDGNDLELRYQKKRELISALNPKLGEGTLIYTNDYLSRQIKAVPQIPLFENKNSNDAGTLKASVAFSCPSPYWEDVEDTVIETTGQESIIENNGDVPCGVELQIKGDIQTGVFIENYTTGQKIDVNSNFTELKINTNVGNKTVNNIKYTNYKIISESKNILYITNAFGKYFGIINNALYSSEDLFNWDFIDLVTGNFYGVYFAKNILFVYGSRLMYTSNGKDWNEATISAPVHKMVYSETKDMFVVVGGKFYIATSSNGSDWITREEPESGTTNFIYYDVIETSDGFVAGGTGYAGVKFCYSTEGTSWVLVSPYFSRENIPNIIFDGEYYYAGNYYTNDITSWNYSALPTFSLYKDNYYFEQKSTEIKVYEKVDTTQFQLIKTITPSGSDIEINRLVYDNNLFYILGNNLIGWFANIETNCVTLNLIKGLSDIEKIIYVNSKYIIITAYKIYTSLDLMNFQEVFETPDTEDRARFRDITYSENEHIIVAIASGNYSNSGMAFSSANGNTWETVLTNQDRFYRVIWSNATHRFYIQIDVQNRSYLTTEDGHNFETHTLSVSGYIRAIFTGGGCDFLYLQETVLTSTDGEDWESHSLQNAYQYVGSFTYIKEKQLYFASLSSNVVVVSENGYDWQEYSSLDFWKLYYIKGTYIYIDNVDNANLCFSYDMKSKYNEIQSQIGISDIVQGDNIYVYSNNKISLFETQVVNLINKLSVTSDMNLKFKKGSNRVIVYPKDNIINECIITYRQKYIGV